MTKFTKEQKREYFKRLRLEWKKSKALAENDLQAEALFREAGLKGVSYNGFYFVLKQMQKLKLKGIPYVDCKTFQGWRENGYKVKKGEKSKIYGITWLSFEAKKEDKDKKEKPEKDEDKVLYPKVYHLFHKTQVVEL